MLEVKNKRVSVFGMTIGIAVIGALYAFATKDPDPMLYMDVWDQMKVYVIYGAITGGLVGFVLGQFVFRSKKDSKREES